MDCSKNEGVVAALPDDPLVEILSRVPAKSVCRFKCVSKAWRDLIADPHHRKKLPQAMQGLFFMVPEDLIRVSFSFIDLTARSVPLDIDPAFSFLTERPGFQNLGLLDSCNGLILFKNYEEPPYSDTLGYVVCNPTTKRWQAVPTCGSLDLTSCAYLAFDQAISSHFHLVQFQLSVPDEMLVSLHVYSSETGTWSRNQIDSQENQGPLAEWHLRAMLSRRDPECAFVNGFLHFIVGDSDQHQIVVVDVQGKARRVITVPGVADGRHRYCYLGQSQGCLHCMTQEMFDDHEDRYKLSIWVLQDYDTQWVLKDTVSSMEIFGHLTSNILHFIVGIHRDRNVVFFQSLRSNLIAYDMDHKENPRLSQISTESMCSMYELLAALLNSSRLSHLCLPQAPLSIDEDDNGLLDDAILEPNSSSTTLFCPGMRSTSTPATCRPPHLLGTANFPDVFQNHCQSGCLNELHKGGHAEEGSSGYDFYMPVCYRMNETCGDNISGQEGVHFWTN